MASFVRQIQDCRHISPIDEVQESDHFFPGVGTDKVASAYEFAITFPRLLAGKSVIGILQPLALHGFVVDCANSLDKFIVKFFYGYDNLALLRSSYILSGFLGQVVPPLLETDKRDRGHAFPFHWVCVLR
ncbi:MAG TPA: hypothetical protein VHX37_09645 [Acidobacteriaceae bacterium]|nr:hypothetical protein [Acidobacteriaceae bacterium]